MCFTHQNHSYSKRSDALERGGGGGGQENLRGGVGGKLKRAGGGGVFVSAPHVVKSGSQILTPQI